MIDRDFVPKVREETIFNERTGMSEIKRGGDVAGTVRYLPVELAYATTVHRAQGLTQDAVQIYVKGNWSNSIALIYVAASRCRKPENLVIVGTPDDLTRNCNASLDVAQRGYLDLEKR